MARYIVTAKNKTRAEIDDACLDIGSRSTCALTLDDPIVAQRHCDIQFAEGEFYIRDLEGATGTYLNGIKVRAPERLKTGDVVIVGASRLIVTREDPESGPLLRVELQEKQFLQKAGQAKDKRDEWVIGDREAWRESEVSFSRFPLLWNAVWGASAAALIVIVLFLIGGVRDALTEPGALHAEHEAFFARVAAGDVAGVPQNRIDAARLGCGACHDPLERVTMDKCYACHDYLGSRHPMRPEADPDPKRQWPAHACGQCHLEHEGTSEGSTEFLPAPEEIAKRCLDCHEESDISAEKALALVEKHPERNPPSGFTEPLPYNTFSHAQHMGEGGVKDCETCHRRTQESAGADGARGARGAREFARVDFEQCMGCHHAEGNRGYDASRLNAQFAGQGKATPFAIAWHGTKAGDVDDGAANCTKCHEQDYDKGLRKSAGTEVLGLGADGEWRTPGAGAPKLLFSMQLRSHAADAAAAREAKGSACASCHLREDRLGEGRERVAPFWHRLHMPSLAGDGAALSAACVECHTERAQSAALARDFYRGETAGCEECHAGSPANAPVLADARVKAGAARERIEFPHDAHVNTKHQLLAKGCLSCHSFSGSGATAFDAVPVTGEKIKDCTQCHDAAHGEIGGGSCEACHAKGDPVYGMAVTDPAWPLQRKRPPPSRFSHYSRGHGAATEKDCGTCHDKVETRNRIDEIELPQENNPFCLKCHVEERQRFHWR